MPVYEYVCRECNRSFEELVFTGDAAPACPSCQSSNAERVLSGFAVGHSEGHNASAEVGPCGKPCANAGGCGCAFN